MVAAVPFVEALGSFAGELCSADASSAGGFLFAGEAFLAEAVLLGGSAFPSALSAFSDNSFSSPAT